VALMMVNLVVAVPTVVVLKNIPIYQSLILEIKIGFGMNQARSGMIRILLKRFMMVTGRCLSIGVNFNGRITDGRIPGGRNKAMMLQIPFLVWTNMLPLQIGNFTREVSVFTGMIKKVSLYKGTSCSVIMRGNSSI